MFKNKKKILVLLLLLIILVIVWVYPFYLYEHGYSTTNTTISDNSARNENSIMIDFNGDGVDEVLNVDKKENLEDSKFIDMTLYDLEGNQIAKLMDNVDFLYNSSHKIIKLNENSDKEYLQWDTIMGPHQVETVFFTVIKGVIRPIWSVDFENSFFYLPFYTSRGSLVTGDLTGDGFFEVIEYVDEYPVDAPRLDDESLEGMVNEVFSGSGDGVSEQMLEILKRENNGIGRGKKVIYGIYSFVDGDSPYFKKINGKEYDDLVAPMKEIEKEIKAEIEKEKDESKKIKMEELIYYYSDLHRNSKAFNDYVRDFWTHGRQNKIYLDEVSAEDLYKDE